MDPFEQLRQMIALQNIDQPRYFYYDLPTGEVKSIKNYIDPDEKFPYLTKLSSELDTKIELNTSNFLVVERDNKLELIENINRLGQIEMIDDIIYRLPKRNSDPNIKISQANYTYDLMIEQDDQKKEFRLRVSGNIKDQYQNRIDSKQRMIFYVTAENDPNILYKTLDIAIVDLLKHHYYTIAYGDFESGTCNIFSRRFFHNYIHMVI